MKRLFAVGILLTIAAGPASAAKAKVMLGVDMLEKQNFALLQGKRVGLITNHTGTNRKGKSTIDILNEAPGVKLLALFAPEHGIRGKAEHGKLISDERDEKTGLPIYSLYGKSKRPTAEMLKGIDALVFDMQDIGTRFYTYSTTLAYAMEEAAKRKIEFVVLDRPNPITGMIVEGEPLDPSIKHFTAYLRVPVRHGMTMGELAMFHQRAMKLDVKLTVVKLEGWTRNLWWDETDLKFRPTSPNIRTLTAAALYPGAGCFEATNVSVGRGTKRPFEVIGAPWINAEEFAEKLNFLVIEGIQFEAVRFKPKKDLYAGQWCGGVRIKMIGRDRNETRPFDLFVYVTQVLLETYPESFQLRWDEIARVTGSDRLYKMLDASHTAETYLTIVHEKAAQFLEDRKPDLLYP